jgi:hypothetical protein
MAHGEHADHLSERLPAREPMDHQVAAGAVAGLVAGSCMWLAAMAFSRSEVGWLFPLRAVAASFLGPSALDSGPAGPVLLGVLLAALTSVLFGLVFTSILPESLDAFASVGAGVAYGVAVWALGWFVLARVLDPILFAAGRPLHMLALHAFYGAVLGLLVPFLRKVLP